MSSATRKFTTRALAAAALTVVLAAQPVLAGKYVLEKGKGVEVCEAYLRNLNLLSDREPMYLYCERVTSPQMPEFSRPAWTRLDVWENRNLIHIIEKYTGQYEHGNPVADLKGWEKRVDSEIDDKAIVLATMEFPRFSGGDKIKALVYERGYCNASHYFSRRTFVLADSKSVEIDPEKTRVVQVASDVLLYRGQPYFDDAGEDKIVIYSKAQRESDAVQPAVQPNDVMFSAAQVIRKVCEFRYHR